MAARRRRRVSKRAKAATARPFFGNAEATAAKLRKKQKQNKTKKNEEEPNLKNREKKNKKRKVEREAEETYTKRTKKNMAAKKIETAALLYDRRNARALLTSNNFRESSLTEFYRVLPSFTEF